MMKQSFLTGRRRLAATGIAAVLCLVALFSFAPVRQAAAQFLSIFRVRTFAVIPVDPAQVERLRGVEDLVDAGAFGEPTVLREPGEPQDVADAAQAASVAGFAVRVPSATPDGMTLDKFTVVAGPAMRMTADRAMMQAVLDAAGAQDVILPAVDTITAEADFPSMVHQQYKGEGDATLSIVQMPSPALTIQPEVDTTVMGVALLRVLGVPAEDAQRLAQTIDWTSTMVIPLPSDVGQFRDVNVDGVAGVLVEATGRATSDDPDRQGFQSSVMVLWQRDGIVYAVEGKAISAVDLLRVADSLQ